MLLNRRLTEEFVRVLAIDFDGTITHESKFPAIGEINEDAIEACLRLQKKFKLALWTCRNGRALQEAIDACRDYGLEFDYVNESAFETGGRKIIVQAYIDDSAWPLCTKPKRDRIDWQAVCDFYGV